MHPIPASGGARRRLLGRIPASRFAGFPILLGLPVSLGVPVLLAIAALACATIGRPFPPEPVQQIRIGETTKAQLLGYFGLPYRRGIEDGDSTWTYVHYRYRLFGEKARTRDLYLRFDPEGRVRSYTYSSNLED